MKFKSLSIVAALGLTLTAQASFAGGGLRHFLNIFRDCNWDYNDPVEKAMTDYERLTTPVPPNAHFPITPFQESDFQTKPWLNAFEYVIVVNNSNSVVQNEELPSEVPLILPSLKELGIIKSKDDNSVMAARDFEIQYGELATKVRQFGKIQYSGKMPLKAGIDGAQTIRIYRHAQLIRVARVSTGRNQFELRGQNPACKTRPAESYYSITEPGYFTFQELMKSGYKSASYDDADMPNAMFYMRNRGIALHEEPDDRLIPLLGRRASGGCTRLDPDTATNLFDAIYITKGAMIPEINRDGTPAFDANGQLKFKNKEVVIYSEGTPHERRSTGPAYSALLIVQPQTVEPSSPNRENDVQFRFDRAQFTSQGPARL